MTRLQFVCKIIGKEQGLAEIHSFRKTTTTTKKH